MSKEKSLVQVSQDAREAINAYLMKNVVTDFSKIPVHVKMTFLQETPKQFIKYREVGGARVPYVDHFYAERALNFISNYNWGSEMIKSDIIERTIKGKTVYEAIVEMKMWIYLDGNKIERYIVSGHTMYENPAITRADALQSAVSKANTKFARQLGMGSNVIAQENRAYEKLETYYEGEVVSPNVTNGSAKVTIEKVYTNMVKALRSADSVSRLEVLNKQIQEQKKVGLLNGDSILELENILEARKSELEPKENK